MDLFTQSLIAGITSGLIYALVGIGYNIVFAGTGVFNLAQGQMLMLGIMFTWEFRTALGAPVIIAVIGAALATGVVNVLVELAAVHPLRRKASTGQIGIVGSLVSTLGASVVIVGLAVEKWGPTAKLFPPYFPTSGLHLGGVLISYQQLLTIGAAFAITGAYVVFERTTRWGIALLAVSNDAEAAAMRGVPVHRASMLAFAIAGVVSGLGGAVLGPLASANTGVGYAFGVKGFVVVAIGGFGSVGGALVGGLILGIAESLSATYWNDQYQTFIALVLVLVVLTLRPNGLFRSARLRSA